MVKYRPKLIALVAIVAGVCAGYSLTAENGKTLNGGLIIAPNELALGAIWEQPEYRTSVRIHNPTSADVAVTELKRFCFCTSAEPHAFVVPAGQSVDVALTLNLRALQPELRKRPVREFSDGLVPIIADRRHARLEGWKLHGAIRTPFFCEPPGVTFHGSEFLVVSKPYAKARVTVQCHQPLKLLVAECHPEMAHVAVKPVGASGIKKYELELTISKKVRPGMFRFTVELRAILPNGEVLPSIPLPVSGTLLKDIHAIPASVVFSPVAAGTACKGTVTLKSESKQPFRIEKVATSDRNCSVQPETTGTADTHSLDVNQVVRSEGSLAHTLVVTVRNKRDRREEIAIPIIAHGLPFGSLGR
jgi:hypothetical protein